MYIAQYLWYNRPDADCSCKEVLCYDDGLIFK